MESAAARDRIAYQYVTGFDDVFTIGLPALEAAHLRGERGVWPTAFVYMAFLTAFPDSHVARKHGTETAERIQKEATSVSETLEATTDDEVRLDLLLEFDAFLKARKINPGTSADLTVASLFAHKLRQHLA
jgi:triphosphoribosyl-dephospho-CoA synthase